MSRKDEPTPGQLFTSAAAGVGLGCLFRYWSGCLQRSEERQKEELEMIKAMATSGVDAEVRAARSRGLGIAAYAKLSGETYTSSPLSCRVGVPALAVEKTVYEKKEKYSWQEGEKIYKECEVEVDGRKQMKKVDTGRRKEGKWIAHEDRSQVEHNISTAQSGLCFRQLGATEGIVTSPSQICLDLLKFDLKKLLSTQKANTWFEPSQATQVSVNVGSRNQQPPSRVLGHEVVERVVPVGVEVFALGDVASRNAASVPGVSAQGSVCVLQPKPYKPFTFSIGSESSYLADGTEQFGWTGWQAKVVGGLGYGFWAVGGLAFLMGVNSR